MKDLPQILGQSGPALVARAPEGVDALAVAELARAALPRTLIHIALDDLRTTRLVEQLGFFAPEAEVLTLPAWDCLPYDRVGPQREIEATRLDTLTRLMAEPEVGRPRVLVTTVNAFLQRLPPRRALEGRTLKARPGERVPLERLSAFFLDNGYLRADNVVEPGEYALRGGILDVFPPGEEQPLRLDFFGDELEKIRTFDPLTQVTTGTAERIALKPVSELVLTEEAIARFRTGYRELFGRVTGDPLYEAVSERRHYAGMEHWLPLFFERLETLADYLPGAPVTLDHQAEAARDARLETIADFYDARSSMLEKQADGAPYRPLPPERLYLDRKGWEGLLKSRPSATLIPFAAAEEGPRVFDVGGRRAKDFAEVRAAAGRGEGTHATVYDAVAEHVLELRKQKKRVLVVGYTAGSRDRLGALLKDHGLKRQPIAVETWAKASALPRDQLGIATLGLEHGFTLGDMAVIAEQDILGERLARPQRKSRKSDNFLADVATLQEGDLVVHVEHGIGRYEGLVALEVGGAPHDCLKLVYHNGDKLFVPAENLEVLSRFGSEDAGAELDRLGQQNWQARKAKVKERLKEMADELIKVAAARALKEAPAIQPPEGIYDEFAARFPYAETEDQLRAIEETLQGLGSGRPMDRLVCGDVGFGKTEIALRAAFVVAMSGRQVAVVVPTTLLARQHYASFKARFEGLPVRIAQLSRLITSAVAGKVRSGLKDGTIDIVVGTHALLGKSVGFRDLGLLIVDEEQHFGVKQKERLKALREDVHVLTLTATPIPRTLQLSLTGVKDLSLIATPPIDRLAVRTFVLPYDPVIVREAILREHFRGGQTFYVCPRIEDLAGLEERLKALVPEIKIGVAHGRLSGAELEQVMSDFVERRFDLLLSTNIVESGLDIPTANTMVIHRADLFGLAQLYQLRGRIGRSKQRGYAYLTLRPGKVLTPAAKKRLEVMQTLDSLGAGFQLASHDLDIRGAGNLLGEEQSGHVREVGIELYQQLLEEAVAAARGQGPAEAGSDELWTPQINLGTSVMIPEGYVPDLNARLALYRRLSALTDAAEIEAFAAELIDRFGPLPEEVENLLEIVRIKALCRQAGIDKVDAGPKGAVLSFRNDRFARPERLIGYIQKAAGRVNLRPDHRLVYQRSWETVEQRVGGVRRLLGDLAGLAEAA